MAIICCTISENNAYYLELKKEEFEFNLVRLRVTKVEKYAKKHPESIIINASLFNLITKLPEGQLIINHKNKSFTRFIKKDYGSPLSERECYPLLVNDEGDFVSTSYNRKNDENRPSKLKRLYKYALVGWGYLIDNYQVTNFIEDEIRWGKTQNYRQIIGQLENDDYFILTCDNAYYYDIYDFLKTKNVKYAYSLDGGRSTKLYIDGKQINRESEREFVPTIIQFSKR